MVKYRLGIIPPDCRFPQPFSLNPVRLGDRLGMITLRACYNSRRGAYPMPNLYTTIGPWTFPTFNLFLALAILVSAGVGLRRVWKDYPPRHEGEGQGVRVGAVADVYLGALVGAIVGARLFHVLL